jgi:hypothetical protein
LRENGPTKRVTQMLCRESSEENKQIYSKIKQSSRKVLASSFHGKVKHRSKRRCSDREVNDVLEKYIRAEDRGEHPAELPMLHSGADISRPLNAMRLAEYRKCKDCQTKPVVTLQYETANGGKRQVDVCRGHWEKLSDTVIGWSG